MSSSERTRGEGKGGLAPLLAGSSLSTEDVFGNPGLLKLELMTHGLQLPADLRDKLAGDGPSAFATSFELDLVLPEGTAATIPVHERLTAKSPYSIQVIGRISVI